MSKVIPPKTVFSRAEVKRRLQERRIQRPDEKPVKKLRRPRVTVVTSVSMRPELVIRVKRDIGEGSFSAGVVKAVTRYLRELDKEKELMRG